MTGSAGRSGPAFSIYDGQKRIGDVAEIAPSRFVAIDAKGRSLGEYPNANAASDAVLAAHREAR
jgi:hypothetical protein